MGAKRFTGKCKGRRGPKGSAEPGCVTSESGAIRWKRADESNGLVWPRSAVVVFIFSSARPDFGIKPGASVNPPAFGGGLRNSQHTGGFLDGHPDEITQLHQFRLILIQSSQFVERLVNGQHLVV